ncbi:MAG: SDR family oxidoreductase [Caldilineales bacterium]|nr:SDR family oxidoreductase [Caldilineales bacterium]
MFTLPRPFISVITGSTTGIGRAIAQTLAAAGSDVIINGRSASTRSQIAVAAVEALGVQAHFIAADVADAEGAARLVREAWDWQGRVDLWVNNAGADILSEGRFRLDAEEKLARLIEVDLWGTVRCSRLAGARMQAQGFGQIINIGWDQAEHGGVRSESGQMFSLVKGGIMAYTRSLAKAMAPNVRANCVAPGWIETAWGEEVSRERYERIRQQVPMQRWGTPEDIAGAILWLASPAAAYITGQTIAVNGGEVT